VIESETTTVQFMQSRPYRDRQSKISQFGPLVSFRLCPMYLENTIKLYSQNWCDHFSSDFTEETTKMVDVMVPEDIEHFEDLCIPDLSSSAVNAMVRQYPGGVFQMLISKYWSR